MKKLLSIGLLLLPCSVFASDCRVVEFPDHFEAICTGEAGPVSIPKLAAAPAPPQAPALPQAPELQIPPPQADPPAAAQARDTAQAPVPITPAAGRQGRQGRPNSADMNAAIDARRKLVQDLRLKD